MAASSSPVGATASTTDAFQLLSAVLDSMGYLCVFGRKDDAPTVQKFFNPGEYKAACDEAMRLDRAGMDAYYCTSTLASRDSRKAENVHAVKCLKLDLDIEPDNPRKYPSKREAVNALVMFCDTCNLPAPVLVDSGYGVHAYLLLTEALNSAEGKVFSDKFKAVCIANGLKIDPTVTGDIARILRVPCTRNHKKPDQPKPVKLRSEIVLHDTDALLDAIDRLHAAHCAPLHPVVSAQGNLIENAALPAHLQNVKADAATKSLIEGRPKSFALLLKRSHESGAKGCSQIKWADDHQASCDEPRWRAVLSIARFCDDGATAIHEISRGHNEYDPANTEAKAALTKGPYSCATFKSNWQDECKGCTYDGKITSPIQLGVDDSACGLESSGMSNDDDAAIARLAALNRVAYDRVREKEAKALGVRMSTLDDMVGKAREARHGAANSPFVEVEPWDNRIDVAVLLHEISATVRRYIICEEEIADAAALWAAMTWVMDALQIAPLVIVTAPEKRCGKSEFRRLMAKFVYRPLEADGLSASVLFRGFDLWKPTLLVDEFDTFVSEDEGLRGIFNIIEDFSLKPRLNNDRGTAILVAASIYDACHYFRLFQNTSFGTYCGIITSYEPNHNAISREPPNSDERYKFDTYAKHVLKKGQTTKQYEDETKRRFIGEPANLKLLIVVSKLLTGFDAPSCTYIYLDNELRDHNLFQAICRTNRLDGDDKDYGYIVDFKELFGDVQQAIAVYSSDELDIDEGSGGDNNVRLKNWLEEGKKQLDDSRQAMRYLCEPVALPREVEQFLHYFCGDAANADALNETEALRVSFYKAVAIFARAFADIAQNLTEAGYADAEAAALQKEVEFYAEIRAAIKKHSGEELDIKPYEADMRHLINTYIQADPAGELGELGELSLTELIIKTGIHDAIARKLNKKGKLSKNAIAEGIINNVRKTIIRDQLTDPRFYAQMSKLLDDLIKQSRTDTAAYEEFLRKAEDLVKRLAAKQPEAGIPTVLHGKHEAVVLFNNLGSISATSFQCPTGDDEKAELALKIDLAVRERAPAGWKGDQAREAQVLNALFPILDRDRESTLALFEIIKNQPGY